jgi:Tfp pilus assembly protein FimT
MMEMMIVVVIVGLMAALAVPNFGLATKRIKFDNIGQEILNAMRFAKSSAVTLQKPYGVFFDNAHKRIVTFVDLVNPGDGLYETGDSLVRSDSIDVPVGYFSTTFGNQTVVFAPNGKASASGNVVCYSGASSDTRSFSVSLLAGTGRAKLQYYH